MRIAILLCLLLVLSACTTVVEATGSPGNAPEPPSVMDAATDAHVLLIEQDGGGSRYLIRPVDPATGQNAPEYAPVEVTANPQFLPTYALSADGTRLAINEARTSSCEAFAGGSSCRAAAGILHLVDVQSGQVVTTALSSDGWLGTMIFSPDAAQLALIHNERQASTLLLFDAETGELVQERVLGFRPTLLDYSADGALLVIYGAPLGDKPGMTQPGEPRVLWVDAQTLESHWEQALPDLLHGSWCLEQCTEPHGQQLFVYWEPAIVLSADGRRLLIAHADAEKLTAVDVDGRTVQTVEIHAAQSWLEWLLARTARMAHAKGGMEGAFKSAVLSPDGATLYLIGRTYTSTPSADGYWQTAEEWLDLLVIDVDNGRILASRASDATALSITPDGAHLLLHRSTGETQRTEMVDAGSLETSARLSGWEVTVDRDLNGQPLLLASQLGRARTHIAVIDPQTFEVTQPWSVDGLAWWISGPR